MWHGKCCQLAHVRVAPGLSAFPTQPCSCMGFCVQGSAPKAVICMLGARLRERMGSVGRGGAWAGQPRQQQALARSCSTASLLPRPRLAADPVSSGRQKGTLYIFNAFQRSPPRMHQQLAAGSCYGTCEAVTAGALVCFAPTCGTPLSTISAPFKYALLRTHPRS